MKRTKTIITLFTVLYFAVSNPFTAKAEPGTVKSNAYEMGNEITAGFDQAPVIQEKPEQWAVPMTGPGVERPAEIKPEELPQISAGQQVAAYASQFIGNPYVYGGTSLTNGADCSGFVMRVYEHFGVSLPRTSKAQGRAGVDVGGIGNAQPGDIVSYQGHIGIYNGKNQLIHASNPKDGIKVSPVNYKPILSVRRVI